ncbi:MAG: hypothetical protein LC648_03800 [Novosphingobium sp.]|nr:hypothetical protein [Novosphingobium sp.]
MSVQGISQPRVDAPAAGGERARLSAYRVVFPGVDGKQGRSMAADDAASALILAQRHGRGRPAELWRGEELVCRIAEDARSGFWKIC